MMNIIIPIVHHSHGGHITPNQAVALLIACNVALLLTALGVVIYRRFYKVDKFDRDFVNMILIVSAAVVNGCAALAGLTILIAKLIS